MASVLYALNDKTGGVLTLNANLIRFRQPDAFSHDVLLLHNRVDRDARWGAPVGGDREWTFEYSLPVENLYAVLRRLKSLVPLDEGVLVANDWLELALAAEYDLRRAVIQIVHDEYHLGLARLNEAAVDVFVAHSREFYDRLRTSLPSRMSDIHYLPYGIPIPERSRRPVPGPLRLLFIGRMTENKGIFDLPIIDEKLRDQNVDTRWTVVGDGPEKDRLLSSWREGGHVRFVAPQTNEEVLELAVEHDVFVLPTRFEGFPVSLLETMGAGIVPVVSNLPGGITEVIDEGRTGYRPEVGNLEGFARAIAALNADRRRLDEMGYRCRALVRERFDIRERVKAYQSLFSRWSELRRARRRKPELPYGSRLDKTWIPNVIVRLFRFGTRKACGKPAAW